MQKKDVKVHYSPKGAEAIATPDTDNRKGGIEMRRHMRMLPVCLVAMVSLLMTPPKLWADIQLEQAGIWIEVNSTDGDAGIQLFLDGEGWAMMNVFAPDGSEILDFRGEGSVGMQGIRELFFESSEPSFEEQTLAELFALFPEGAYRFEGMTLEGEIVKGMAKFTHNVPAGPEILFPGEGDVLDPETPVVISWKPVSDPFPGTDASTIQIVTYEVIVTREKPKPLLVFDVLLPGNTTEVTVPSEFIQPKAEYTVEVLAKEESGNQTITQLSFQTK